jgi:HEPN domain-containing protein/predicted nucleotidyltransferase
LKTSLTHLPADKQEELRSITETIVELIQPAMIILFGSYSRGNWVEDRFRDENGTLHEYKSDYDILVVTEHHQDMPAGLAKQIRRHVKKAENFQTIPHIIFHDIKFLNKELEDGHYFFADIVREGTMLHDTGKYALATPRELSPKDRAYKAKLYYDTWFKTANGFMRFFEFGMQEGNYSGAIFQLHQAAERYYVSVLLVFTDYKPRTHDLNELNREAGYVDARIKTIFPNQTDEEKRLFTLLVKAYIDSRYKLGYIVAAEDLQWLANRVQKLKELTEVICLERIEGLWK